MQVPKLMIRKGMVAVQNGKRPAIQIFAIVDPVAKAKLEESYLGENLFKRSAYANGLPEGCPRPTASLATHVGAIVKSDACPEITVKTILNGQVFQGQTLWEVKAFEFLAMRAFDALVDLLGTVVEMERQTYYAPPEAQRLVDTEAFYADAQAEAANAAQATAAAAMLASAADAVASAA